MFVNELNPSECARKTIVPVHRSASRTSGHVYGRVRLSGEVQRRTDDTQGRHYHRCGRLGRRMVERRPPRQERVRCLATLARETAINSSLFPANFVKLLDKDKTKNRTFPAVSNGTKSDGARKRSPSGGHGRRSSLQSSPFVCISLSHRSVAQ